jgi:hypothetical protein
MDLPETPYMAKDWCPTCEPERDPTREILAVKYCWAHPPSLIGSADCSMAPPEDHAWSTPGEAGGQHSILFNDLLRGEGWSNR